MSCFDLKSLLSAKCCEEFNEVTSKYALLFQEIEQKLLLNDLPKVNQ